MNNLKRIANTILLKLEQECFSKFPCTPELIVESLGRMGIRAKQEKLPTKYSKYNTMGDDIFPCVKAESKRYPGWDLWICENSFLVNETTGEIIDNITI